MPGTDRTQLEEQRFKGFLSVGGLKTSNLTEVPRIPGVYVFLRESDQLPQFLNQSTGGRFKGKDPTVEIVKLQEAWVTGTEIVYIGKAGKIGGSATLQSRLRQYLNFGAGKPIGHWGGRYIWQLADADSLVVCWRATEGEEPRDVEKLMITAFENRHGRLPFANLAR